MNLSNRKVIWDSDEKFDFAKVFKRSFDSVSLIHHKAMVDKGFWEAPREDGTLIALMHSELSEALEALRKGDPPDDKIPQFSGSEAELADCILRIMDFATERGLRVAEALVAKMDHNKSRPRKHGKEF